jgi:hypothetical protein
LENVRVQGLFPYSRQFWNTKLENHCTMIDTKTMTTFSSFSADSYLTQFSYFGRIVLTHAAGLPNGHGGRCDDGGHGKGIEWDTGEASFCEHPSKDELRSRAKMRRQYDVIMMSVAVQMTS